MDRGSGVNYYLYDGLGSTRQLVNTGGTVTDTWGYSAFGELASHTGSTVNPFLFNAQQFDGASGDYYLRARYYDQSVGRFISQDPFSGRNEDPITLHRYLYAGVDPINNFDPDGDDFSLSEAAISTGIQATLGGVISGAVVNVLGGDARHQILAIMYGAEAGGALGFAAVASENFLQTLGAGLIGGAAAVVGDYVLDKLVQPEKKGDFTAPNEYISFLQGFAGAAVPTALNLSNSPAVSALLTGAYTFNNDLYKAFLTGVPKELSHDVEFALIDAVAQGVVAYVASAAQTHLDGTSLGKKEVIDFIVNKVKASELVDIITAGVFGGVAGAFKDFVKDGKNGTEGTEPAPQGAE